MEVPISVDGQVVGNVGYSEEQSIIEISNMSTQTLETLAEIPSHIVAEMIQQGGEHSIQAQYFSTDGNQAYTTTQFEVANVGAEEIIGHDLCNGQVLVHTTHPDSQQVEPAGITEEDRQLAATLVAVQQQQRHAGPTLGLVGGSNGQLHNVNHVSQPQMLRHQIHEQGGVTEESYTGQIMVDVDIKEEQLDSDIDEITEINVQTTNRNVTQRAQSVLFNGDVKEKKSIPHKKRIPPKLKAPSNNKKNNRGGVKYTCFSCNVLFTSEESLKEHQIKEHGPAQPNYTCDICKAVCSNQLKFFEHLKAHYEGSRGQAPQNSKEVEDQMVSKYFAVAVSQAQPEIDAPRSSKGGNRRNARSESNASVPPAETPDKVILICSKCSRTFRREKTYLAHVETCTKHQDTDEEAMHYEIERSKLKTGKRLKLKKEEPGEEAMQDASMNFKHMLIEELSDHPLSPGEDYEGDTLEDPDMFGEGIDELSQEDMLVDDDGNMCPICDDTFSSKVKLEAHVKKLHPDIATGSASKSKKKRAAGQRRQEVLKCTECQRIFNHRNSLVYHMRSHTGERPHQCEMCGKSFFATSALKVHMRLHSGEKPYKCEHCGRHFRQWGDLKYHVISIHSDIRQYQCEFCGKDFARKYSLIVHRRIHTGERNYKCEFCGKCFRAASYLQNHRRIHTGEKPHACTICGKPFRVRSDMKRHMASHNRDHNHAHAAQISQVSHTQNLQTTSVVTVSNANQMNQIIATIGPQIGQQIAQAVRNGAQTIQVQGTQLTAQQAQQILEESGETVITGDLAEGTPINITLTQDGRGHSALEAAAVTTLQSAEIQDGQVIYPRDGTLETVTIRETSTGTLYVWPVFMN